MVPVVGVVPLLVHAGVSGRGDPLTALVAVGLGLVIITVIVVAQTGRRTRLRRLVAVARPDATLIPAFAESPGGLTGQVPVTILVAVLTDRMEVWAGGREPLSTLTLTDADVRVDGVLTGSRRYRGIRVTNGACSVAFVPAYSALVGLTADLERALRELGEDPADHVRR